MTIVGHHRYKRDRERRHTSGIKYLLLSAKYRRLNSKKVDEEHVETKKSLDMKRLFYWTVVFIIAIIFWLGVYFIITKV